MKEISSVTSRAVLFLFSMMPLGLLGNLASNQTHDFTANQTISACVCVNQIISQTTLTAGWKHSPS